MVIRRTPRFSLMTKLGLTVNEKKTRLVKLPEERFDFLGYTVGRFYGRGGRSGARQGSCRLIHAASGCLSSAVECAATTESRSGLRVTGPVGVQSRVAPDQRAGLRSRALRYSSWRASRMA